MKQFTHAAWPARIVFGRGSIEATGEEIRCLCAGRALVYAGSEVTPILGETDRGVKTTRRGPEILPEVVVYDPDLSDSLPVELSITSGLNAMAHAAEGVYARDSSPIYTLLAVEGLRPSARLCPTSAGISIPGISTPATAGIARSTGPGCAAPSSAASGCPFTTSAGAGLHDFAVSLGAPSSLAELGVAEAQLDHLAELATAGSYWCPRPLERVAVRALLQRAWTGERPA